MAFIFWDFFFPAPGRRGCVGSWWGLSLYFSKPSRLDLVKNASFGLTLQRRDWLQSLSFFFFLVLFLLVSLHMCLCEAVGSASYRQLGAAICMAAGN